MKIEEKNVTFVLFHILLPYLGGFGKVQKGSDSLWLSFDARRQLMVLIVRLRLQSTYEQSVERELPRQKS